MTTDKSSLLDVVSATLSAAAVPHALVGAAALAAHGISRSTLDIDLLVTDRRVLEQAFWTRLPAYVRADIRRGDEADPLVGVVRLRAEGQRDVDIVVGRGAWESEVIARAAPITPGQAGLRAALPEDLILLKLYAGGSQDKWDIEQLLALHNRAAFVVAVDSRIGRLPLSAQQLWASMRSAK